MNHITVDATTNATTDATTDATINATALAGQVNAILAEFSNGNQQDQLLPVLHAIQDALGFIASASVTAIAAHFNLSRAEVHGVITFYHYFRSAPPARHVIQICRAEACQSMGGDNLLAHAERTLGCTLHARSADGNFSLEPVYCLGLCATSPAIMVGDALHARVTPARFDALIANVNMNANVNVSVNANVNIKVKVKIKEAA